MCRCVYIIYMCVYVCISWCITIIAVIIQEFFLWFESSWCKVKCLCLYVGVVREMLF